MEKSSTSDAKTPNYQVKDIEPLMTASDMRARLACPSGRDNWHYHREAADHYFILEGEPTILTQAPEEAQTFGIGRNYRIAPGRPHLIASRSVADCRFLLLQGVGAFDWVRSGD